MVLEMERELTWDDESPQLLCELVIGQLMVAGITAGWHHFAGELGLDRNWVEDYIYRLLFGLNVLGALLGPLAVLALTVAAAWRRQWKLAIYAGVEAALWLAHFQALRPWLPG